MPGPGVVALRRGLLAVSVLFDVDLVPGDDGVVLPGPAAVLIGWDECSDALGGADPEAPAGHRKLVHHLRARTWAARLDADALRATLVAVGLPVGHALHPGPAWVRARVLGGALDLGLGALGLDPADPEAVCVLPPQALATAGVDPDRSWPAVRARLEELGATSAVRLRHDARGLLRPFGPYDVVTLLGARAVRQAVAGPDGLGAAVVPMRRRGWTRIALVDPAFGPAAAAATDPAERGFPRPLLVTADEVTVVREGGDPLRHALQGRAER